MAELTAAEKHAISHRGRAARLLAAHLAPAGRAPMIRTKSGAAGLSIASNALLIALKLAAGAITGSIAIITEAIHSLIDLVASVVAFVSVRKADEPADAEHPYGHEKVENLAATIEGMLILVGAGVIIYEATHRLVVGAEVESLGVGIAVMGFSVVANLGVSTVLSRQAQGARIAGAGGRRRPPAHRRADLGRGPGRPRPGRDHRRRRLRRDHRARRRRGDRRGRDPDHPPLHRRARRRGAADEEMDRIEAAIAAARTAEVAGYHKLRARRAGSRRHIDFHVQFRSGTSLERAHELAHADARRDRGRDPPGRGPDPRRAGGLVPGARRGRRRARYRCRLQR